MENNRGIFTQKLIEKLKTQNHYVKDLIDKLDLTEDNCINQQN